MLKQEFETLTMKAGNNISQVLFNAVNRFYMQSEDDKFKFAAHVFGTGNTADDILHKVSLLFCGENRKALAGNPSATEDALADYDKMIFKHCWQSVRYGLEL
jgi:hypothetical protein